MSPRIIFAGTPEFAVPSLKCLLQTSHVCAVYTQPDRPAGRGRKLTPSPVKQCALAADVPVYQPQSLRTSSAQQELAELAPDLMVVAAYGLLLPAAVLAIPILGCVNVHASLLPRWRGAAPIQRALLAGDLHTGITLMQMEVGLDTGPMLARAAIDIPDHCYAGELHDQLSQLGATTLNNYLPAILANELPVQPQDDSLACYAAKISKSEAQLDWNQDALQLERQVRAFNPWPVATTHWQDKILRIWRAQAFSKTSSAAPGQVIDTTSAGIEVACGEGVLLLQQVQLAGKRAQSAQDFLNAHSMQGHKLGRDKSG